jgi:ornithine carbamoyltransferase
MKDRFRGKDFLTLMDYSPVEISYMLDVAQEFKRMRMMKEPHAYLEGRTIAMVFEKHSTRTRFSFQAGIAHLGMQSFYSTPETMQLARGEPIKDTARILDRYCDALVLRTYGQEIAEEYAEYMTNPVVNALTNLTHPCQGLADLLTIREHKGKIKGNKLTYVGDPYNVCQTLMVVSSLMGMDCNVAVPKGWAPAKIIVDFAEDNARKRGTEMVVTDDLKAAREHVPQHGAQGHRGAEEGLRQVSDQRRDLGMGKARRHLHALPPRLPGRGDDRQRHRGAPERRLRRGGEQDAHREGCPLSGGRLTTLISFPAKGI